MACYPKGHAESRNLDHDLDVLLTKQRLGADFAITQLFFEAQDFLEFVEVARLAGVRIPLIPGIMPMTSLERVKRMGELSGLEVPEGVEKQLRGRPRSLRIVDVLGNHGHGLGRDARLRKDVHGTHDPGALHVHIGAL